MAEPDLLTLTFVDNGGATRAKPGSTGPPVRRCVPKAARPLPVRAPGALASLAALHPAVRFESRRFGQAAGLPCSAAPRPDSFGSARRVPADRWIQAKTVPYGRLEYATAGIELCALYRFRF